MDPIKTVAALPGSRKAFSLLEEFKTFAFKGNVIDLAVGVVIGTAFGKIIDSLVKNLLMPLAGLVMPSEQGYAEWKIEVGEKTVPYGLFISEVLNFLIVAMVLFLFIVKFLGWVMNVKLQDASKAKPLTKDQELLTEIRDLLKREAA
jgi:large conductance mechanosensitive channel